VLFSNDQVAAFINSNFEPCWEMVRPVPMVRIDFGNGTVITRTLHGNIATYACSSDGHVLDVLPGIYNVAGYLDALDQLRLLAWYARSVPDEKQRAAYLQTYHEKQVEALKKGQPPGRLVDLAKAVLAVGKGKVERPLETVVAGKRSESEPAAPLESPQDVASWKELAEDTRINETARRLLIHSRLAKTPALNPAQISKWLYKEVLHADLDDPYLGLGNTLFGTYPFAKEDKGR
jgi:hypothetical protein